MQTNLQGTDVRKYDFYSEGNPPDRHSCPEYNYVVSFSNILYDRGIKLASCNTEASFEQVFKHNSIKDIAGFTINPTQQQRPLGVWLLKFKNL